MVTREELEEGLNDKKPFQTKNIDHDFRAISLLRERIPYDECKSIIDAAEHDIIYLCDIETVIKYITPEDILVLADCNVLFQEEYECLALFV